MKSGLQASLVYQRPFYDSHEDVDSALSGAENLDVLRKPLSDLGAPRSLEVVSNPACRVGWEKAPRTGPHRPGSCCGRDIESCVLYFH